ncbi:HNH endonuclease [Pseudomonas izuensis]|uniref:HNH endonuclease n=1 Tax=Pseudomonas izuensis TaxID=2684212 RepID=A0ABM7RTV3_9PSED|nr:HNH endonuclease [Pseudomonas izuensis]BCX67947.1 HNH endonuclease [Pseudomonas izuensis]
MVANLKLVPVVYTVEQQILVDKFNALPFKSKTGDFWKNTHKGEYADVKEAIKEHYLKSQNYTCPYCKQYIVVGHLGVWDAEHIIAKDENPQFMFEPKNLCVSCKDCNGSKSNKEVLVKPSRTRRKFPEDPDDYKFCHPHFHDYAEHIRIIEVAGFYMPLTEKGIALIEICGLLRFVLKCGGYNMVDNSVGNVVVQLGNKLMEAQTPAEQVYLMTLIGSVVEKGLESAALAGLDAMMA